MMTCHTNVSYKKGSNNKCYVSIFVYRYTYIHTYIYIYIYCLMSFFVNSLVDMSSFTTSTNLIIIIIFVFLYILLFS